MHIFRMGLPTFTFRVTINSIQSKELLQRSSAALRKEVFMLTGVYKATKKDGTDYFRASITYQNKHISLGSFSFEVQASSAYHEAKRLLTTPTITLSDYHKKNASLSFKKWVTLINFRDNGMYIKTPIYLKDRYFYYYFSNDEYLIFDVDDLFYYTTHSIMRRGGHLFVADYGMQVNILSRYGIKNFAVAGRDYQFINGNAMDFRYSNLKIINRFHGVCQKTKNGKIYYETKIHWNGDFIVGRYQNEIEAAVAYNKAATIMIRKGYEKEYPVNFIEETDSDTYRRLFQSVAISKKIKELPQR